MSPILLFAAGAAALLWYTSSTSEPTPDRRGRIPVPPSARNPLVAELATMLGAYQAAGIELVHEDGTTQAAGDLIAERDMWVELVPSDGTELSSALEMARWAHDRGSDVWVSSDLVRGPTTAHLALYMPLDGVDSSRDLARDGMTLVARGGGAWPELRA